MKKWWSQFQISNRLDDGSSAGRRPDLEGDPDLRRFAEQASALDRALHHSEAGPPPPFLHGAIMSAVRERGRANTEGERGLGWGWVAPAAVAVLVLASLVPFQGPRRSAAPASNLAMVETTLRTGAETARDLPAIALSPLHEELNRVNQDLDRTAQALVASFPGL